MIKFINKELFNVETVQGENDHGVYYKTMISSQTEVKNPKTGEMNKKIIASIISPNEDYNTNISIQTKNVGKSTRISIKSSERNKFDTDVYFVAIPFNGFIEEIAPSFQYRIYRGIILQNEKRSIEFNGESYKKIAYMIVVPNTSVFKEDHKYHVDEISLVVNSYNLESQEDGSKKTIKKSDTIIFTKDNVEVKVDNTETEPVNADDYKGKKIFPLYKPANKDNKSFNKKPSNKSKEFKKEFNNNSKSKKSLDDMLNDFNKCSDEKQKHISNRSKKR